MAVKTQDIEDKIKAIEEKANKQIEQLKARKEKAEARKLSLLLKKDKANDTRKKILAGALIIQIMENDEAAKNRFMKQLDGYLKRDDDRALFGLKPLEKQLETPTEKNHD